MKKLFVELIDVGGGNIGSVQRCLDRLGVEHKLISAPNEVSGNYPLVLPGVGSFGAVMQYLQITGLDSAIVDKVGSGTPLLGICVGLQILFDASEESPGVPGLKLLSGDVIRFRKGKVPQTGWNKIVANTYDHQTTGWETDRKTERKTEREMQREIQLEIQEEYVYFVNSYFARPIDRQIISYTADYFEPFCAAVNHKNISAFQFHPEKSGKAGEKLLTRWLSSVG